MNTTLLEEERPTMNEPQQTNARNEQPRVKRRTKPFAIGLAVTLIAAGGGAYWYTRPAKKTVKVASAQTGITATVARRDLAEQVEVDGRLGYGATSQVIARSAGTVTWTAEEGSVVELGKPIASLDGRSTVVMGGTTSLWRTLGPVPTKEDLADVRAKKTALATAQDQVAAAKQSYESTRNPTAAKKADAAATLTDAEAKSAAAQQSLDQLDTTGGDDVATKQASLDTATADRKRAEDDLAKAIADDAANPRNQIADAQSSLDDSEQTLKNAQSDVNDSTSAVADTQTTLDRAVAAVAVAEKAVTDAVAAVADAKVALQQAGVVIVTPGQTVDYQKLDEAVRNARASLRTAEASERTARDAVVARNADVDTATRALDKAKRALQKATDAIDQATRARDKAARTLEDAKRAPTNQAATVRSAQAKVDQAKASEELAKTTLARAKEKIPNSKATAKNDLETAKAREASAAAAQSSLIDTKAIAAAKVKLETAQTSLNVAAASLADAQANLTTTPGDDIAAVEQFLVDINIATPKQLKVDRIWTPETTAAVKRWQTSIGTKVDGTIRAGDLVPSGKARALRVQKIKATSGTVVAVAIPILETTEAVRKVNVDLDVKRRGLAKEGAKVTITLPDAATVAGTIKKVDAVAVAGTGTDAAKRTINVEIALDSTSDGWDGAPVKVALTGASRPNVLAVPTSALVALATGGFGVEKVTATGRQYVVVEPGLYADGMVEIKRGAIAVGDKVVVPS
jgi:multidrug efflux pump subunit AcrA (membrane-fusion protein)